MFSGDPLRLLLQGHLGYHAFEDARLRLHVTATDVVTGAGVILQRTGPGRGPGQCRRARTAATGAPR